MTTTPGELLALAADCDRYAKIIEGITVVANDWKEGDAEQKEPRSTLLKAAAVLRHLAAKPADEEVRNVWAAWNPEKGINELALWSREPADITKKLHLRGGWEIVPVEIRRRALSTTGAPKP